MDTRTGGHNAHATSITQPPASEIEPVTYCAGCEAPIWRQCSLCGESEPNHTAACSGPEWCRRIPMLCGRCLEIEERRYDG